MVILGMVLTRSSVRGQISVRVLQQRVAQHELLAKEGHLAALLQQQFPWLADSSQSNLGDVLKQTPGKSLEKMHLSTNKSGCFPWFSFPFDWPFDPGKLRIRGPSARLIYFHPSELLIHHCSATKIPAGR